MGRTKKIIIAALIIVIVLFGAWKLLMNTVLKSYAPGEGAGERKEEPILAVYDNTGKLKTTEFNHFRHLYVRWSNEEGKDMAKQLAPLLSTHEPVMVTVEVWPSASNKILGDKKNILSQVADGQFDDKIKALCSYLSAQPQVLIRFAPDMEVYVNRYPWQMQSSEMYAKAFRHFAEQCRKNAPAARIVWAPAGYPGTEEYWPGADWVDMVSVTLKGKSELMTNNYPEPATLEQLIERKIIRTRFFNRPVLVLGSEKLTAADFKQESFDNAVKQINENRELLFKDTAASSHEKPDSLLRKEGGLVVGAYDPQGKVVTNPMISVEHLFVNLGRLRNHSFRKSFDSVIARNHDVIVTMEPWRDKGIEKDPQLISNILSGKYDDVFKELFSIISSTNRTVYLRWLHEMEIPITRYPWQSQDPIEYIKAFRYFVNKLQPKPSNIFIVWGPAGDRGSIEFWPGSDVVDYVSIAIYGLPDKNITDHNKQESFNTIFKRKYNRLRFAHKPLFITEFGVKGPQDYKKKWLHDAAVTINENPAIIGINYFNYADSPKAWGDIETPDWSTTSEVFDGFLKQLHTGSIK